MLLDIIERGNKEFELTDTKYTKKFFLDFDRFSPAHNQRLVLCGHMLQFIYDEYRYSKECPFSNIKICIDKSCMFFFSKEIIILTPFYLKHKVVLDKILGIKEQVYATNAYIPNTSYTSTAGSGDHWQIPAYFYYSGTRV